ncbi:hypothetical protein BDU57DRAFT_121450 [Ampelomyces quisqualis]|uniref:Bacteriocin-protection, YdeI or OmpD-associated-domain-containing protein n=1 Tax=Ampelomyces quisqualis TaxID=50730 RepID=A0A6A5QW69_AMPQU|nr:hypothetical protein BDU57DRAFT_121450 [Ampelomyces quisqualis]
MPLSPLAQLSRLISTRPPSQHMLLARPYTSPIITSRLQIVRMSTAGPPELPKYAFPSVLSFEAFLEREHASAPGIHLKFAKKASGIPSITCAEAVEVALCYGWIDGRAHSIDDKWWTVRYTPRRAKSIWSQKNVTTVARLIEEGRMKPAGITVVEAAKADGRWDRAYAGPATMSTPEDFTQALAVHPTAEAYFQSLKKSEKYTVLMQLATISEKNRAKKIDALVQGMAAGKQLGAPRGTAKRAIKPTETKAKKIAGITQRDNALAPSHVVRHKDPPKRSGLRPRTAPSG